MNDRVVLGGRLGREAVLVDQAAEPIVLPLIDSDYRPGITVEWVLYAAMVVPIGAVLARRGVRRAASDYKDAWQLLVTELSGQDSEQNGAGPRTPRRLS